MAIQHLDYNTINSIVGLSTTETIFQEITLLPTNNTLEDHTLRIKGVHSLTEIIKAILCRKLREAHYKKKFHQHRHYQLRHHSQR
jgi:hypothetical protein